MALVSVVIPAFGRPPLLGAAVDSVLEQSVDDVEVVVVDDASPDPVALPDHPRVRVVRRTQNGGAGAARNTGMDEATGRYVTFLDDDDLYLPGRLEMGLIESEHTFALCRLAAGMDANVPGGRRLDGWEGDTILDSFTPHLGQLTAERSALPRFDERFRACEDIEFWLRLAQLGTFETVDRAGYVFREHDGARHGNATAVRVRERGEILELHDEWFSAHPRARAFHLRRIGQQSAELGKYGDARRAFARSLRVRPDPRTLRYLATSLRPDRSAPS